MTNNQTALIHAILRLMTPFLLWGGLKTAAHIDALAGGKLQGTIAAIFKSGADMTPAIFVGIGCFLIILVGAGIAKFTGDRNMRGYAGFSAMFVDEAAGFVAHFAAALFFFKLAEEPLYFAVALFLAFVGAFLGKRLGS